LFVEELHSIPCDVRVPAAAHCGHILHHARTRSTGPNFLKSSSFLHYKKMSSKSANPTVVRVSAFLFHILYLNIAKVYLKQNCLEKFVTGLASQGSVL
jgi:hypothetical protein